MFARGHSKERGSTQKVAPPAPSYMTNEQFASYLADLRNNRVNRPGGARPLPSSIATTARRESGAHTERDLPPLSPTPPLSDTSSAHVHQRAASDVGSLPRPTNRPSFSGSLASRYSNATRGRDYYPDRPVQPLKPSEVVPSATYMERGQRWMEKEEAVSLRMAMEDMQLKDKPAEEREATPEDPEEKRIYEAALNEAAELVWQHQNPSKVPQPGAPYRYKSHLRKDSYAHARTASAGMYGGDVAPSGLARDAGSRSVSASSSGSDVMDSVRGRRSLSSTRQASDAGERGRRSSERSREGATHAGASKSYEGAAGGIGAAQGSRRRSSLKRNISGEIQKPFSGAQIWEEPEGRETDRETSREPRQPKDAERDSAVQPLRLKPKNPLNRVQFAPEVPLAADASPPLHQKPVSRTEIHRNPPTQSRNPLYTTNARAESPPVLQDTSVPRKHGMEIRSEDIRQATSMKLKDRSSKLPTPSAVSDNPGRPIVSFDKYWKPQEEATDDRSEESRRGRGASRALPLLPGQIPQQRQQPEQQTQAIPTISVTDDGARPLPSASPAPSSRPQPPPPTIQIDGPPVPSISVSNDDISVPSIVIEPEASGGGPSIPIIVTPDEQQGQGGGSRRPLPTPQSGPSRTRHQPAAPRGHWSPAPKPVGSRATARCHECGHPIEGRFVSLAGSSERFHPQCFVCYTCGTSLEALEISPEPDNFRAARLERIKRRAAGEVLPENPGETMAEDGDDRLRFYCHLDWHELFAPRCKHCKTPIMGEHVVALGAHWHFGHFFCAECGDPFERGMTHIEKDGYAWCVSCQTKRTERRAPKCRRCRTAVIGQYIQALGGEWHDECFRCATCGGGFDDGQIFPRDGRGGPGETVVLCTGCMQRELKA